MEGNVLSSPRVRFAPSPTGPFHLGSARTALFNWLFARHNNGKFVLRIEDTDKERSKKEFEDQILEALIWLGIDWDEGPGKDGPYGPYRQSERFSIYKSYLQKLLKEEKAYFCYCTKEELEAQRESMIAQGLPPKYSGHCRNLPEPPQGKKAEAIRFKTPEAKVEFKDIIRGTVSFDASLFGDMVIAKDLESPLYNFAVVIDDYEMKITHVIRGEDHISNTPRQILFQKALGFPEPVYAHLPLILSADRSKLSKRYAETSLLSYRDEGYLPDSMVNFLVLLGWHPKDNNEIFNREELIKIFDLKRVQKAGAIFNEEKLVWINGQHIKKIPLEDLVRGVEPILNDKNIKFEKSFLEKVLESVRERMKTVNDFWNFADFFFEMPDYEAKLLIWDNDPPEKMLSALNKIKNLISKIEVEDISGEAVAALLGDITAEFGRGSVLWPLRVAVSGKGASPDPLAILEILGKKETLLRIDAAIKKLEKLA